jgi:F-type H+-transporting ATPase subunit alpha
MRQVAGQMRLDLAQYRELAAFAQFASDLDSATRHQLERGARLTELLKQDKYEPVPLSLQVAAIYAGTQGYLDKVATARVKEWEEAFTRFMRAERKSVLDEIDDKKALDDALFARLKAAISTFNHQFGVEGYDEQPDPGPSAPAKAAETPAKSQEKPKPAPKKKK